MDIPKITIEILDSSRDGVLTNNELIQVRCNITDPTDNLDISDFKLPEGLSATNVKYVYAPWIDGSQYLKQITFNISVSDNLQSTGNTIALSAGSYTFKSGSPSYGVSSAEFGIDSIRPTLAITMEGDLSEPLMSTTGVNLTFAFSESVSGFTQSDISVTPGAGTISAFQMISSTKYIAIFTPNENTNLSFCQIFVNDLAYRDQFGNPGKEAVSAMFSIDTPDASPPVPTLTLSSDLSGKDGIDITVSFNEVVSGFDGNDIQLNAPDGQISLTSAPGDGNFFTFHYLPETNWPAGGGLAQIAVQAGGYADLAGNLGLASAIKTINVDLTSPTPNISVSDPELVSSETCRIFFTFDEPVKGFGLADLSFNQPAGTLENFTQEDAEGKVYSVMFTPQSGIEKSGVKILLTGQYFDLAGNLGTAAESSAFSIDTLAPEASMTLVDAADTQIISGESLKLMLTFTEAIANFDLSDLSLNQSAGALDNFTQEDVEGKVYSVIFMPQSGIEKSDIKILLTGQYLDLAGNLGTAAESPAFSIDTLVPEASMTLVDAADTQIISGESLKLMLTFTEAIANFDLSDLSLNQSAGALDNFKQEDAEGKVFSVIFTPQSGIEKSGVTMVLNGEYTDLAGNLGKGTVSAALSIDTLAPGASIAVSDANLTRGESALLTFTFTEAVSNFSVDDVRLDGAAAGLTQFTEVEAGKKFTALYTPPAETIDANNIFSIAADSYTDLAGNLGEVAQSNNVSIDTVGKILFGTTGSDAIVGTAGADRISGLPQSTGGGGKDSSDLLWGLSGADVFVLGSHDTAFYNDGNNSSAGTKDFAAIADFNKTEGDKIEVKAGTYFFSATSVGKLSGAGLYLDTNSSGIWDAKDELIGFLVGVTPGSVSVAQDLIQV
jgi:hypothetical protein